MTVATTGFGCDAHYGEGTRYGLQMLVPDDDCPDDASCAGQP